MEGTIKNVSGDYKPKAKKKKYTKDIVPISTYIGKGIFKSDSMYIKTFEFDNLNFKLLSKEQEAKMLASWCQSLNSLEPAVYYKYTIVKRKLDIEEYKENRLLKEKEDRYNHYRKEYNNMLLDKIIDVDLLSERRFFQIATRESKLDSVDSFFHRQSPEVEKFFKNVGTSVDSLSGEEYLKIMWDFLHQDSEGYVDKLDIKGVLEGKKHIDRFLAPYQYSKDRINDCIKLGGKYYRALYMPPNSVATYLRDTVISELIGALNKTMCISVDILPVEQSESYKLVETLEFRNERNIRKYKRNQAKSGDFTADPPYSMRKKSEQIEEYNQDLQERDQRLMLGHICLIHAADSIEELNEDSQMLKAAARKGGCELTELTYQQEDGFITALPFGVNRFLDKTGSRLRTFTTEAMASFTPFSVKEFAEPNGIYYGQNKLSKNPIFINRKNKMNSNSVILGSSGSGKSFKAKEEMISTLLSTEDNIIILDPEQEYKYLVEELGGQVISLSVDSNDYINAMEISKYYNDNKNPVNLKAESILTLYGMAEGVEKVSPTTKSILDRCIKKVYKPLVQSNFEGRQPTLTDLRELLLDQPEEEAKRIALTLELYTKGSLNLFSKQTNVNINNRLICFDISELGSNLMSIAMLIITDFITNTLAKNRRKGVYTWVYIDELYLMFLQEYTAQFFYKLWKRIRKYGGLCTGITQELNDLMKSSTARTLLSNSEVLILLSASMSDGLLIQDLFGLDDIQMSYITEVGEKNGTIKIGSNYLPFTDSFPTDTDLYKIISTKFSERSEG